MNEKRSTILDLIINTNKVILGNEGPKEVFDSILEGILRLTESEYGFIGYIFKKNDGTPYLKTISITDISWNEETSKFYKDNAPTGLEFYNLKSLFGYTIATGESVLTNSPSSDPRKTGIPPGHPALNSYLGIPIFFREELIGMMGIANKKSGYTKEDIELVTPLLDNFGIILKFLLSDKEREDAFKAKDQFLARMSHELRTPIAGIVSGTELLIDSESHKFSPKEIEIIEIIEASANRLKNTVEEVLDFSKVSSLTKMRTLTSFHLENFVKEVLLIFKPQIKLKNLKLELNIDPKLPAYIKFDQGTLSKIMTTLLDNATKFSKNSKIDLILTLEGHKNDLLQLGIEVKDKGEGISKEFLPNIFVAFSQEDDTLTRKHEGAGLGLSILKKVVDELEGKISIKSEKGVGTEVKVLIDCEVANGPSQIVEEIDYKKLGEKIPLNILIVDDDNVCLTTLGLTLKALGYNFKEAINGKDAIDMTTSYDFDLILMDLRMPVMDGIEASKKILEVKKNVKIVAVTGDVTEDTLKKCHVIGITNILAKPVRRVEIAKTILNIFSNKN